MNIEVYGFIFILIFGTLGHFSFEWTKHNPIGKYFFALNESTWEHMKLVVFPSVLWFLIEIPFVGSNPNFFCARFVSLFAMLLFIPLVFYTYQIFMKDNFIIDIIIFIMAIVCGQFLSDLILKEQSFGPLVNITSLILFIVLVGNFIYFAYKPGNSFLFRCPITNKTGIKAHYALDKYHANLKK